MLLFGMPDKIITQHISPRVAANQGGELLYTCTPRDRAGFHAVSVVFEHYIQPQRAQACMKVLRACDRMQRGEDVDPNAAPSAAWRCDVVRDPAYWGPVLQFGMIVGMHQRADVVDVSLEVLQLGVLRATRTPEAVVYQLDTDTQQLAEKAAQQRGAPFRAVAQRALNLAHMLTNWPRAGVRL